MENPTFLTLERPAPGRPYEIIIGGRLEARSRGDLEDVVKPLARDAARAEPGASIIVNDEWCNEVAYRCRFDAATGRLWARGF